MGLTLDVHARAGVDDVTARRDIGMVATLLVALATAAAVAGVVNAVLRPDAIRVALAALALAWVATAIGYHRAGKLKLAAAAALVTLAQAGSSAWFTAAPIAIAAWLVFGLALPGMRLGTPVRRIIAVAVGAGAVGWTGWLATIGQIPSTPALAAATASAAGAGLVAMAVRCRRATTEQCQFIQWLTAAVVTIAAAGSVLLALNVLLGVPAELTPWALGSLVLVPLGLLGGQLPGTAPAGERVLIEAIVVAGLAVFVVTVYLVVVVGLVRPPVGAERDILLASVAAALVVAVLALPVRARLANLGRSVVGRAGRPAVNVVGSFSARMSRAVPLDELLLQLAESLHAALGPAGAEVWVGPDGVLTRTVSVPHRPSRRLVLSEHERIVVGRARIGGESWSSVWLPDLLSDSQTQDGLLRVAPAAHLGELLGLLVVRRPPGSAAFSDKEDATLVELARQVGLALHNVRLDSALQASLAELQQRNAELQASRLRIVTAADESRRAIERDLHDGAQQHLVTLAVKLGLARQLVDSDPSIAATQLEELRADVQTTIAAVRELAHGIYPPLLRQQGLGAALRTAATRSPLPCAVTVELPGRYPVEVETAVYFCCLEAIHNAGKYAGTDASITVHVDQDGSQLRFTVSDDGTGFETGPDGVDNGHGLINMRDRLGAIGGSLEVTSASGNGATVRGIVPATPIGTGH
jgi:signal transduction histidine kinase